MIETDKKLTMHIFRHAYFNILGNKIPTLGYQANFIHNDIDSILDSVVNF